jgi:hypothetical protein
MTKHQVPRTMFEDEQDREELATRMRKAIYAELTLEDHRVIEDIFKGRGDRHVLLGAIADLAAALIVRAEEAVGFCDVRGMVDEVYSELLKWLKELEETAEQ